MQKLVIGLIVGLLWLCPIMVEVGEAGTTDEQRPEQKQLLSNDNIKLLQERLKAEGVYAGPMDGTLNAQTEAALRQYQEKKGIPVSGAADEATLRELQIRITPGGTGSN
jgi:peptidoglycan hydrolase-like protein with peptidoglycan-binding domain